MALLTYLQDVGTAQSIINFYTGEWSKGNKEKIYWEVVEVVPSSCIY